MARIVTVYTANRDPWDPRDMSGIRWQKISEALAHQGHEVDIATDEGRWRQDAAPVAMGPRLHRVPLRGLDWSRYDVVKTLFHLGFETLSDYGGTGHPFIISKLGSVVGSEDLPGIYFYGDVRRRLYRVQTEVHRTARFVTVLSPAARDLWLEVHGDRDGMLLVPGAVDEEIPEQGPDPYTAIGGRICIFSGNLYNAESQPEANRTLTGKLNELGRRLTGSGVRVCFQGPGDTTGLDSRYVTVLGSCSYIESWNYLQHASVGVVVSAGPFMHNNESTKIYHYLRAGLPVVSEEGFPNDHVVRESGLGYVSPNGAMDQMAHRIVEACAREWDRKSGVRYVLEKHTWYSRARIYEAVIAQNRVAQHVRGR